MSTEISVAENVKELIKEIISRNNLKDISDIKYQPGSKSGDGYSSKTVSVHIISGNASLRVFLKCGLNMKSAADDVSIDKIYEKEIYFYDEVCPTYAKFLEERSMENFFKNIPKCHGTSIKDKIVALEDLKEKGFTLYDRRTVMNDTHINFVLKTFAKFHAISFALKDQENETYEKLISGIGEDFFSKMMEVANVAQTMTNGINSFVNKLDPIEDKYILDKCNQLDKKLIFSLTSPKRFMNEYSIITQGDCWCNNMMFLYDNEKPIDIKLLDWQLLRVSSPVFDISYFFYTIASEKVLNNLHLHLRTYHEELSKNIRELGSDPEILYPLHVFEKEWKQHALYGYAMAFMLIRYMLSSGDEIVNMEGMDLDNPEDLSKMFPKLKDENEYIRRMKILTCHVIEHNYL